MNPNYSASFCLPVSLFIIKNDFEFPHTRLKSLAVAHVLYLWKVEEKANGHSRQRGFYICITNQTGARAASSFVWEIPSVGFTWLRYIIVSVVQGADGRGS